MLSGPVALVAPPATPAVAVELLAGEWPGGIQVIAGAWPGDMPGIRLLLAGENLPDDPPALLPEAAPDAYAIATDTAHAHARITVTGHDPRGLLYGIGRLLREVEVQGADAVLPGPLNVRSAPAYPLRGHQLGYRAKANSYDAWTPEQYERYIRDLVLFGCNAIENIPFEDKDPSTHMPVPREVMNVEMSRICAKYGIEYWVWSPATFDLADTEQRAALLEEHRAFFAATPRLDAVFFPGGDPGNNHPELVMPFLTDLAAILAEFHPGAKLWISLQGFDAERVDWFFAWLEAQMPDWLGGVVAGPGSPPIPATRARLPLRYGLRHYPDITHTVRSQYPTPWWDPAYAFTLGREPVNPEPQRYARVHNVFAPYTTGFIAYSDGAHDDVNKAVWLARGWDPEADVREILVEYARVFLRGAEPETVAAGLLALEKNWEGALAWNGGVDATLALWQSLEKAHPDLHGNWRFQMHLMRAYYDAYTRRRLIHESALEREALERLASAEEDGLDAAMDQALGVLTRADEPVQPAWRQRVVDLCEALFHSIGLQTSVEKYGASGGERGAVLDYLDVPLNNRWWIEDQFAEIRALHDEAGKRARLETLRTWDDPGPGGYYDDIGNVARSPRVVRGEHWTTDPNVERNPNPDGMWWNNGFTRERRSWVHYMDWPIGVRYEGLDPEADYLIRTTGNRTCLLRANGQLLEPDLEITGIGERKTFVVPRELTRGRELLITFDTPFEPDLNWRDASRLTEIWLMRR